MANKTVGALSEMAASVASAAANKVLGWYAAGSGNARTLGIRFDVLVGALARLCGIYIVTDPKFGAVGDGSADDTTAIQAAIAAAPAGSTVYFPHGTYKVTATLAVSVASIQFLGAGFQRSGINYTGSGACIELGTDDGQNWDAGNYNGAASGFAYVNMFLKFGGTGTALSNGSANYGSGTYAIRDWRGGSVRLARAYFQGWDYWFWGVQSDINNFSDLVVTECHSGCYLGARSDQATIDHVWTSGNDRVFHFEGSSGHNVRRWITDTDGSASINPVLARNSSTAVNARYGSTLSASAIVFDVPWLESAGSGSLDVEAWFEVGTADATQNGAFIIRHPFVAVNLYSTGSVNHVLYLVKADNCTSVEVQGLMGRPGSAPWTNLRAVLKVANAGASTNVPVCWFSERDQTGGRVLENFSTTAVEFRQTSGDGSVSYQFNSVGGTGSIKKYGGPNFRRIISGSVTWDPPSTATGALSTATTVTVTGAALGNTASASFTGILPAGCFLVASVTASNTVTVQLANFSGSTQDLASGTLRAYVTQDQFQ